MLSLLKIRGFIAFVCVAFINAFVDLGHKIIVQNTLFKSFDGPEQVILTAVVNALILLPFILLFTPAGFLSDRYSKPMVMRWSARSAVVITLLITMSYYQGWFYFSFAMTFILALQSALYSPAKYAYIRDLVGTQSLSEGNGWIQSATMVAILSGIVIFSLLFEQRLAGLEVSMLPPDQLIPLIAPLGWFLVSASILEMLLAERLPLLSESSRPVAFNWQGYLQGRLLKENLSTLWNTPPIIQSIFGLAIFWTISQVMLAVFPSYIEQQLGETNTFVIQGAMALAGVGIMLGSVLAGRLSTHHINTGLIPIGALGVAVGLWLLPHLNSLLLAGADFLLIGASGALMTIPLNALIQFHAPKTQIGKVLAGNNFIQNIVMLTGLVMTVVASVFDVTASMLLYLLAMIATGGALFAVTRLPESFIQLIVTAILSRKYKLQVLGFEHLLPEGKGMLLLGNHISWLDWAMVQLACPRRIHFVMERAIYEQWYLKWFLDLFGVIPISGGHSKTALQRVNSLLKEGKVVCLFPEGAISYTGQLGVFRKGFERAAKESDAQIVPFYLRGLWGSRFSRSGDRLRSSRIGARNVIVSFGAPMSCEATASQVKHQVLELSIKALEASSESLDCIDHAFIRAMKSNESSWAGTNALAKPKSSAELLVSAYLCKKRVRLSVQQNVGLLLPTSVECSIALMATVMAGKRVVPLDYTQEDDTLIRTLNEATISTVITTKAFLVQLSKRNERIDGLLSGVELILIDELLAKATTWQQRRIEWIVRLLPSSLLTFLFCQKHSLDDVAVVLFSSDKQSHSQGVLLTHRNLMANITQMVEVYNLSDDDVIVASLSPYTALGMTSSCLLPLVAGVPFVCVADPMDSVTLGKAVARYNGSVLCSRPSYLMAYASAEKLHPIMLISLRLVISASSKLAADVKEHFESRFKKVVYEGYGTSETNPLSSVNIPDSLDTNWWTIQQGHKVGTVGMALPGTMFRVVDPDTLLSTPVNESGQVLIGGGQIVSGYLNPQAALEDNIVTLDGIRWYRTDDVGRLDEDGFLTIEIVE